MKYRKWVIDEWSTTSFVPVAGWTNHFTDESDHGFGMPCPGVLVQELRAITRYREVPGPDGRPDIESVTEDLPEPYDTRVVAADLSFGYLEPALDVGNYVSTSAEVDRGPL